MALRLLRTSGMGQPQERPYAIWVDTGTLLAAQKLAELAGLDVETFTRFLVQELHDEARQDAVSERPRPAARVIPINGERRRHRQVRRANAVRGG